MGSRETVEARFERWCQKVGRLLAVPALLVLFVAGALAIGDAVLAPAPAPDDPAFVDTVLGSRAVVAAIRLAVIFAGVFVVVSVVALIARRQWLTRVGPVHVSERVATANADSRRVGEELAQVAEDDNELRQKIAILDKRLASLSKTRKG
jgi:hypothetical protein